MSLLENNEAYCSHWHTEVEIILPLEGKLCINIGGKPYLLDTEDIVFLAPGELHAFERGSNNLVMIVQFPFTLINNLDDLKLAIPLLQSIKLITKSNDPEIHEKILAYMKDIKEIYKNDYIFKNARAYADLINIFTLIAEKYTMISSFIPNIPESKNREYIAKFTKAIDYINENYANDISSEAVAEKIGYSKYHFSRMFKYLTKMSFNEYVNHIRIKKAENLLINADLSITDIAYMCGFHSLSSFNRNFRLLTGCSPREFRSLHSIPR